MPDATAHAQTDQRADWRHALVVCETWIAVHVCGADPMRWSHAIEASFRRKCFSEIALNVVLAEAMGWRAADEIGGDGGGALAFVRQFLLDRVDDRLIDLALRSPDRASLLALPLAYACTNSRLSPGQVDQVQALLASPTTWGFERLPFRYLDLAVACTMVGAAPPLAVEAILSICGLVVPPDPAISHRDAFYGITHATFYAALLGQRAILDSPSLAMSVQGGILRCNASGDVDLALELIVVALLAGIRGGGAMQAMLDRVAADILRQGCVDAIPSELSTGFGRTNPDEAFWADRIHTMEVAALALRAALSFPTAIGEGDASECATDETLGTALLALYRNDLRRAADALICLRPLDLAPDRRVLAERAEAFIAATRRASGSFGHLVDERRGFELAWPNGSFEERVQAPIDLCCGDLIASRRVTG